MLGLLEARRQMRGERVDPGMRSELLLLEPPQFPKAVVPQVEPAVRREHADRLEQIVERRAAHPQQRVAGRSELDLLGAVLEDEQQAAVGQRLGDHPQMLAAGQQPLLLVGGKAAGEPAAMLGLPFGKVAHFGQVAGLAHRVDHPVEFGAVGEEVGGQRKQARERLVEEDQAAIAAELGDAGRQPVEHVALGAHEAGELGPRLLLILDVDRIAGDAVIAERHLDDVHHPPFPGDGDRHIAVSRLLAALRLGRRRRLVAGFLDQLDPAGDDLGGILGLDRGDIGAVDHGQREIGAAMPHRKGRDLDQPRQRLERGRTPLEPRPQHRRGPLGLGDVGEPQQHRALAEANRGGTALDAQDARGSAGPQRQAEASSRSGLEDSRRQFGAAAGAGQRAVLSRQVRPARRQRVEAEHAGEPLRPLQRAVAADQQRQHRSGGKQRRDPLPVVDQRRRGRGQPARAPGRPQCRRQPRPGQQRQQGRGLARQRQHGLALRDVQRSAVGQRRMPLI